MQLTINGETREIDNDAGLTVRGLIERLDLPGRGVAVEINRQVVPRAKHESTPVREGDVIELVTLVGGG